MLYSCKERSRVWCFCARCAFWWTTGGQIVLRVGRVEIWEWHLRFGWICGFGNLQSGIIYATRCSNCSFFGRWSFGWRATQTLPFCCTLSVSQYHLMIPLQWSPWGCTPLFLRQGKLGGCVWRRGCRCLEQWEIKGLFGRFGLDFVDFQMKLW